MRYKIYQLTDNGMENFPTNRGERAVYQDRTKKLIELGFRNRQNDFQSQEEALKYIHSNEELSKFTDLTILPFVSFLPPIS